MMPYKDEPRDLEYKDYTIHRWQAIYKGKEAEYLAQRVAKATAAKFA